MRRINVYLNVFILIIVCFFSYGSYAKGNYKHDSSIIQPTNIKSIFPEKLFYEEFERSTLNTQFRVLIKTESWINEQFLASYGSNIRTFKSYRGIAITATKSSLLELINRHYVKEVWNNSQIIALNFNTQLTSLSDMRRGIDNVTSHLGIAELWNEGLFGDGVRVAILDSGIKLNHPALNETRSGSSRIIATWNFLDNTSNVEDDNGHGTALAGIIGSNGRYGYAMGIAPNSLLIIGKIIDSAGKGTIENLIAAIDWAIENNAEIINLSVGRPLQSFTAPEIESINYASDLGVIVCVAAGNHRYVTEFGNNDLFTIISPGAATKAITVGAVDNNNVLYEHSSAGPVAVNYDASAAKYVYDSVDLKKLWLKPDIVAPGVMINTTSAFASWNIVSGTSFAASVAAGVCALLKQRFPYAHSATIKAAFLESADKVAIEYVSPLNVTKSFSPNIIYQGAGLINIEGALTYLEDPPLFSIWPEQVPFFSNTMFINSKREYMFHIFVNHQSENSIEIEINKFIDLIIDVDKSLLNAEVGQYDLTVSINTEGVYPSSYRGVVSVSSSNITKTLDIDLLIVSALGRLLIDFFEQENINSVPYGALYSIVEEVNRAGYIPYFRHRDSDSSSLSDLNLNNYEAILLFNFDGSEPHYSKNDIEALKDFMLPGGEFGNGAVAIFPTRESNLTSLNNLLEVFNAQYAPSPYIEEVIDTRFIFHNIFRYPYSIESVYIPNSLVFSENNASIYSALNRYGYYSLLSKNGSTIVFGNNAEMFLNSPYIYNPESATYEDKRISWQFADNQRYMKNILYNLYSSRPISSLKIDNTEIREDEYISGTVTIYNYYKYMPGWDLYITLEYGGWLVYLYNDITDLGNGTYTFSFRPIDLDMKPGNYDLNLRFAAGTLAKEITIIAKISWGPILVEGSIVVSIIYLVAFRKKSPKEQIKTLEKEK